MAVDPHGSPLEALMHPQRLRIVVALVARALTPQEIASALPDIAQATLYRHLAALTDAGILTVVEERPVRGTIEKRYALSQTSADMTYEAFLELSPEANVRYFASFMALLLGQFRAYVDRDSVDFARDGAGYRTMLLNVNEAELEALQSGLRALLRPAVENSPGGERKRILFSMISIPE